MSGYIPAAGETDPAGAGVVGAIVEFIPGGDVAGPADPVAPAAVVSKVVAVAPGAVAFTGGVVGVVPGGAGVDPAGTGVDPAGAGVDPAGAGVALEPTVAVVGPLGIELRTCPSLVST